MVTEITPANEVQQGMFDGENRKRANKVMRTLDNINNIFGTCEWQRKDIEKVAIKSSKTFHPAIQRTLQNCDN